MNNQSEHSVLSDEDIDYWDKTEEDVISPCMTRRRSKRLYQKRPSAPPEEELDLTPPKRHKTIKEVSIQWLDILRLSLFYDRV